MQLTAIHLETKLSLVHDYWNPRVVAELNGQSVKLVKFQGEFIWHHHAVEDELFLVVRGSLCMQYKDETDSVKKVNVEEGEMIVVPRGVLHCPVASSEEVHVLLFEPVKTINTGEHRNARTRLTLETI